MSSELEKISENCDNIILITVLDPAATQVDNNFHSVVLLVYD